jgi:hypothetical protein
MIMGWDFGKDDTPQTIAARYVKGWDGMRCLEWIVTDEAAIRCCGRDGVHRKQGDWPGYRWILCVLMERSRACGEVNDETSGPLFWSCGEVLDMTPQPAGEWADNWRREVRSRAATITPFDLLACFAEGAKS